MDPNAISKGIRDKIHQENLDVRQSAYLEAATAEYSQATTKEEKSKILRSMVFLSSTNDKAKQLDLMTFLRRVLLDEPSLPSSELVVQIGGSLLIFVKLLMSEDSQLHLEAACILNMLVASGALEINVTEHGDVPIFDKLDLVKLLLTSSSDDIRDQALHGMADAAVLPRCRDFLLNSGALDLILSQNKEQAKEPILETIAYAISNMCRGEPQPPFEQTRLALPALENFVLYPTNSKVLGFACEALSYIYDGSDDEIQIRADVCKSLLNFLKDGVCPRLRLYALRTVVNIMTRDPSQTQALISYGTLAHLLSILTDINSDVIIKLEACRFISMITAGKKKERIQSVIDAQLISPLVTLLKTPEIDIKKKAACAISNALFGGTLDQIDYLVKAGCVESLQEAYETIVDESKKTPGNTVDLEMTENL